MFKLVSTNLYVDCLHKYRLTLFLIHIMQLRRETEAIREENKLFRNKMRLTEGIESIERGKRRKI